MLVFKSFIFGYLPDSRRRTAQMIVPAEGYVPAEQKLSSIRTQFVERVSGSVLNQILDKLLDLDIINDEEMQSVKTQPTTQDKARKLIDMVRKKGAEASSVLIAALRKVDPSLSRQLKLSWRKIKKRVWWWIFITAGCLRLIWSGPKGEKCTLNACSLYIHVVRHQRNKR